MLHNVMTIADLHIHTTYSPDSLIEPSKLYDRAKKLGLDVICITDHNIFEESIGIESIQNPGQKPVVIKGVELSTDAGEILVFGLKNNFWKKTIKGFDVLPSIKKVLSEVEDFNGVAIWAHPFRDYIVRHYGSDLKKFEQIQIIEALNGGNADDENESALAYAKQNDYSVVGGSDAHSLKEVGRSLTLFKDDIECESDLISALKNSRYIPISFSDFRSKDLSKLIK